MMKKTIFFMLCLAPLGVQAAVFTGGEVEPSGGTFVDGINVSDIVVGETVNSGAPNYSTTLWRGPDASDEFSLMLGNDITVSDTVYIVDGYHLGLGLSSVPGTPVNMSFGKIRADGNFSVEKADAFSVTDTFTVANGVSILANSMTSGAMTVSGGDAVLDIATTLKVAEFHNIGGGNTNITADTSVYITGGDLENTDGAGDMTITTGGELDVAGNVYNSSNKMNIDAGNIVVDGTIKNDSNDSTIIIESSGDFTVSGGNTNEASFVNSGNLKIVVDGTTTLEYGLDLSAMGIGNTFELETGSLVFGEYANTDRWLNAFSNKLSQFTLNITDMDLFEIKSDIYNGLINSDNNEYNANANMTITAQALTADSVTNRGNSLTLDAQNSAAGAGGIVIAGVVEGYENTTTLIKSAAKLDVGGDVTNRGNMTLNGMDVTLTDIANSGVLKITSPTSELGSIAVSGDVANESGELTINGKEIEIAGTLTNRDGTTNIVGSNKAGDNTNLQIGAIDVSGGVLDLTALAGGLDVTNGVTVSGGKMNLDNTVHRLTAGQTIDIDGDLTIGGIMATNAGDVNIGAYGNTAFVMTSENGNINIDGNINANFNGAHTVNFAGNIITVGKNVTATGTGNKLVFGGSADNQLTVKGAVVADTGATIEIVADDANVGLLNIDSTSNLIVHGTQITATDGAIDIGGGLYFAGSNPQPESGLIVAGSENNLTLKSDKAQVEIGGTLDIGDEKTLNLSAEQSMIAVGGAVSNAGTLNANAQTINMGNITNSGTITLDASENVALGDVFVTGGTVNIYADAENETNIEMGGMNIANGAIVNIDSNATADIMANGAVIVSGDVAQGNAQNGALNLIANDTVFAAQSLAITGNYVADAGSAIFNIDGGVSITGDISVDDAAGLTINGATIALQNIENSGQLALHSDKDLRLELITNTGDLTLDSGAGIATVNTFAVADTGIITLMGGGLTTDGVFTTSNTILYQNYTGDLTAGEVNIESDKYAISASKFDVAGVNQFSGYLQVNSNDINVAGDIEAYDLRFAKSADANAWIDATVGGNVSGGVDFWGLKRLDVGGYYTFNNNSDLWAAIMPYDASGAGNTTSQNYWSTVVATGDNNVGEITNAEENAGALITVGKQFISEMSGVALGTADDQPQIGITLFDTVDTGTAIWLLHAEEGINVADGFDKLRNLDVKFCNGDGSICIDYADTLKPSNPLNGTDSDLPIYISERDTNGDGVADSLYIVFDPAFGGPVEVFKIQPIVAEVADHTRGEYVSAGALDNLIAGQLLNTQFYNDTPIEVIPEIFKGTNFGVMAQELYDRMEYYNMTGERDPLARFSRLFQARELEQIAGAISLNEHTNFRDFEDRMLDEFIWNRNRSLKKAWLDVDYGFTSQDVSDGKRVKGDRFSVAGGFDWQESETMILGLTARISNSSSDNSDAVELGYLPNQSLRGTVDMTVDDLNIGFGGYLMKILGEKTRLYGNAFLDVHMFDIARNQTFMDRIDGSGTAFSLISEWGLMHDWLNQYIVGNAYARVGYNFGFDITEHAAGQDYMDMQSDGYLILTPGYSLIAQKRIYPSAWFQIRPYASIGVEYDVLGAPDFVKYKFAPAHTYTKYDIDIDPLWANIGGGVEFLSAMGLQFGIDYRYQYNDAIQLHNIKVTGSYRF